MRNKAEMKQLVRANFKEDRDNELLGFLEVENTIEADCPADYTQAGAVLVYYRAHTGEITCELLDDMVGFILDRIKTNVVVRDSEARKIAEYFCEPESDEAKLIEMLEALGLPNVLAQAVIPAWDDETNMFEEFLESLGRYVQLIP